MADVLARVGDKWSVMVIMLLGESKRRFSDLNRSLGSISKRMLSLTLRRLERDGIVARTVFNTVPPAVEYDLTGLGRSLWPVIEMFGHWVVDHQDDIISARCRFDVNDTRVPASSADLNHDFAERALIEGVERRR